MAYADDTRVRVLEAVAAFASTRLRRGDGDHLSPEGAAGR